MGKPAEMLKKLVKSGQLQTGFMTKLFFIVVSERGLVILIKYALYVNKVYDIRT